MIFNSEVNCYAPHLQNFHLSINLYLEAYPSVGFIDKWVIAFIISIYLLTNNKKNIDL